jgi:hypothetical protein
MDTISLLPRQRLLANFVVSNYYSPVLIFLVWKDLAQIYPDDAYWVYVQSQYVDQDDRIPFNEWVWLRK